MDAIANEVRIVITGQNNSGKAFAGALAAVKAFTKAVEAETAKVGKTFTDSFKPLEEEAKRQTQRAPKQGADAAGAFARGFSKRLESAFKALPKVDISADTTDAQIKLSSVRSALEDLSGKTVGVDIDSTTAMAELRAIEQELESIADGADVAVRMDTKAALAQIAALKREAGESGRDIGDRLTKAMAEGIQSGAGDLRGQFSAMLKGVFSTPVLGPVAAAAAAGIGAAVSGALANVMGGMLVAGIGAQLTTLGVKALFHVEKINKEWSKAEQKRVQESNKQAEQLARGWELAMRSVNNSLKGAAQPLIPVIDEARKQLKSLAEDFAPALEAGYDAAAGPMKSFIKDLGDGLRELKPAIEPLMSTFGELLDQIGPQLPGLFEEISNALTDLSGTMSENKGLFATIFVGLLHAIPLVISAISGVASAFATMIRVGQSVSDAVGTSFNTLRGSILGAMETILQAVKSTAEILGKMPGPMGAVWRGIAEGVDGAITKVHEWQRVVADSQNKIEIKAEIRDLAEKLAEARRQLDDPNLTKERRAEINANIDRLNAKLAEALIKLGDPNLIRERKASLTADIDRLKSRIADAKKELDSPNISRERKARLNADIAALQAKLRTAQNAINALKGKSVSINITTYYNTVRKTEKARASAHGGILGSSIPAYAGGGLSGAGAGVFALVGEQGPELVNLPYGSTVIPAGGTRRILDDEGLDYDDFAGYAKGGKTGAKKKPKPKKQAKKAKPKKPAKKSIHQLTPPKKKAKAKPKVTYGVDSEGNAVELWDIPEPEPKKQALKANDRKSSGAQSRKANDREQARKANDRKSGAQARKANDRKPAKKSIHQLTQSDVKKAKAAKKKPAKKSIHQLTPSDVKRKKSIHQLTPSDVHGRSGGSDGVYIDGSQGGGYVDTYDGAYADSGEVSVSNLEGGSAGPSWSGMSGGGGSVQPVVNVYVQGSIRSDRDIVALIRDAFLNGGFRGVLPT